jgi:hypothetical protein
MSLTLSGDSPKISADGTGVITSGTAVASTSGTSIDFTGIPSWVKRITVMFDGVSTNGTSNILVQLGDSGGIENTGYLGSCTQLVSGVGSVQGTAGFIISQDSASNVHNGGLSISLLNSTTNTWSAYGVFGQSNRAATVVVGGSKPLSSTLDRVRITTVNGTDTFDAGSINILFE